MKSLLAALYFVTVSGFLIVAQGHSLPEGSIIAWRPPLDAIDTTTKTVELPKGWQVCDFSGSAYPNVYLKGMSADDYAKAFDPADPTMKGLYGGAAEHAHPASADEANAIKTNLAEKNETHAADTHHSHKITVGAAPNDPPYAAVIWLCSKGDQSIAEFSSTGYGGDTITLARVGTGFVTPMPRSYAVCNTGPVTMRIWFRRYPPLASATGGVEEGAFVEQGECVGMDKPAWLHVTRLPADGEISGQYYALRSGTFPKDGQRFKLNALDASLRRTIASARTASSDIDEPSAICKELPNTSPLRKLFYSSCPIALPNKGNYRICFPKGFLVGAPDSYAFGAIWLIVDPQLIKSGFKKLDTKVIGSAVPMGSCIDLWDVDAAIILIAPANPLQDSHDPSKITEARVQVRTLGYDARMK